MPRHRPQGLSGFLALAAVSGTIFAVDLLTPPGVESGMAHGLVVVLAWRSRNTRLVLGLAGLASAFILVGALFSSEGNPLWMVVTNRLLSLLVVWVVAGVICRTIVNETAIELDEVILDNMFAGAGLAQMATGKFLYVNPRFEQMFGYEPGELIGMNAASLNAGDEDSAARLSVEIIETARTTGGWSGPLLNRKKDGTSFWCHASVRTFHHPVHGLVLVGVQEDISELRAVQEELETLNCELEDRITKRTKELEAAQASLFQAEKMAVLGRLSASVSHELRNPLGVVQNSFFVLQHRLAGRMSELDPIVERIDRNIRRCATIITDMLDYARSSAPQLDPEPFDDWLTEVVEGFDMQHEHQVELTVELGCAGVQVGLDGERFRRVIVNLLENGYKAVLDRPHRETEVPRLTVSTTVVGGRLALRIDDSGIGLPVGHESKVFEPFFSMKTIGVGLGLAIVKPIVEAHGGAVSLTNHDDRRPGVRAEVLLPIIPPVAQGATDAERRVHAAQEMAPS